MSLFSYIYAINETLIYVIFLITLESNSIRTYIFLYYIRELRELRKYKLKRDAQNFQK